MDPRLTDYELGWVVAWLEGEGTFSCTGRARASARVSTHRVQREPLDRMQRYTGVGKVHGPYPGRRPADSPYYVWWASTEDSAKLMALVRPHMSPKRQAQIDLALASHQVRNRKDYRKLSRAGNDAQRGAGNPGQKRSRHRRGTLLRIVDEDRLRDRGVIP